MSFRAIVVVGNEKGQVGVGVGKAGDVIGAVRKGVADGKKHLVKVPLTRHSSIPTLSNGRDGAASVLIRPAAPGTGVIAGGSIRTVLELAGIKNVLAKRLGSKTPLNNARAAMVALIQSSYSQGDCKRTGNLPRADLLLIRDDSPTRLPQSQQRRSSPQIA
jgi:small subunit ribosomal protein S5